MSPFHEGVRRPDLGGERTRGVNPAKYRGRKTDAIIVPLVCARRETVRLRRFRTGRRLCRKAFRGPAETGDDSWYRRRRKAQGKGALGWG
jgi:hypothetical protein